jgi:hypothetical protein
VIVTPAESQHVLCLNLVTRKGVSTPLLWKTVDKDLMKHNRARYEDQLLSRLKEVLPQGVDVSVLADRGFADQKFFRFLDEELQFKYVIRIKQNTMINHQHTCKSTRLGEKRPSCSAQSSTDHLTTLCSKASGYGTMSA